MSVINSLIDNIPFGKYKGKTVDHVLIVDPLYMEWFVSNVTDVQFSDKMKNKIGIRIVEAGIEELREKFDMPQDDENEIPLRF